jgi:hypothetical protein
MLVNELYGVSTNIDNIMFFTRPRTTFLFVTARFLIAFAILTTLRLHSHLRWGTFFSDVVTDEMPFPPRFPGRLEINDVTSMTTNPTMNNTMKITSVDSFWDDGVSDIDLATTTTNDNMSLANPLPLSPVCFPFHSLTNSLLDNNTRRTISRIYFAHMRKASGTTLRSYLSNVATQYGLDFAVGEGGRFELPGSNEHTLYVTHFRDPYRRSLSHFEYEIRWTCQDLVYNTTFVPTLANAVNLISWIYEDHKNHHQISSHLSASITGSNDTTANIIIDAEKACRRAKQRYLWECSYNCYIRWMNHPDGACDGPSSHQQNSYYFSQALRRFRQYDVVVDVDRLLSKSLKDGNTDSHDGENITNGYVRGLEQWFGLDGILKRNIPMFCFRPSRNANRRSPLIITNETRTELYRRNQADYDLIGALTEPCGGGGGIGRKASESTLSAYNERSSTSFMSVIFPSAYRLSDFVHSTDAH